MKLFNNLLSKPQWVVIGLGVVTSIITTVEANKRIDDKVDQHLKYLEEKEERRRMKEEDGYWSDIDDSGSVSFH